MYTHCQRCGRPFSRPRPYDRGARCRARLSRAIATLEATHSQVAHRAAEALRARRAHPIPLTRIRAWRVRSTSGRTYIATPHGCNCEHHLRHTRTVVCHHQMVAAILAV